MIVCTRENIKCFTKLIFDISFIHNCFLQVDQLVIILLLPFSDNPSVIYPILPLSNSHASDHQSSVLHPAEQQFEEIGLDENDDFSNHQAEFDRKTLVQDHQPKIQNLGQITIQSNLNHIIRDSSEDRANSSNNPPLLLVNKNEQLTVINLTIDSVALYRVPVL